MSTTFKTMLAGFIFAALVNLPLYAQIFNKPWPWASGFPLGLLTGGMQYMKVFFHELGHTITAWFYGYPTLPMFDFEHGGGYSALFGEPITAILVCIWAALAYGIYYYKDFWFLQIVCGLLLVVNLASFYDEDLRSTIIDFMGPAAVPMVASFLLIRALFDLAPRGGFERFLNAFFGFGFIFFTWIDGFGLLQSNVHRLLYLEQKGNHGVGDFDKIADRYATIDFQVVVGGIIALNALCLVIPFVLFIWSRRRLQLAAL